MAERRVSRGWHETVVNLAEYKLNDRGQPNRAHWPPPSPSVAATCATTAESEAASVSSGTMEPSLIRSCASTRSVSSLRTEDAKVDFMIDLDELREPPQAIRGYEYHCVLRFLPCAYKSQDKQEWRKHCCRHFRKAHVSPPTSMVCHKENCRRWRCATGDEAWIAFLEHVAKEHYEAGNHLSPSDVSHQFLRYLWDEQMLDDEIYKSLTWPGGSEEVQYTFSNRSTVHRRERRQQGGRRLGSR